MGTSRNFYFDRSNYFYTQIVQKDIYEKISYNFLMRLFRWKSCNSLRFKFCEESIFHHKKIPNSTRPHITVFKNRSESL